MTDTEKFNCIAETGAKVGDKVVCKSIRDDADHHHNWTIDKVYQVVQFGTQLCVNPNGRPSDTYKRMPRVGYGAFWELVA